VLRLRDSSNFPDHVVKVLRQVYAEEFSKVGPFKILELIKGNILEAEIREKIDYLTMGALLSTVETVRLFSVRSLALLKIASLAPILELVFHLENEDRVREEALWGLSKILGAKAEASLLKALEDPSALIRRSAARYFMSMPSDIISRALPRLQAIMNDDPDKDVRLGAEITVDHYEEETKWGT
jgi:HEAT repeats